jgi:hypothetical protein
LYVQRAAQQLAAETDPGNQVFLLRVGQLARTRMYRQLDRVIRKSGEISPQQAKTIIQAALAALKVLDSRDRTAFKLLAADAELPAVKVEGDWGSEDEPELKEATMPATIRCAKMVDNSPVEQDSEPVQTGLESCPTERIGRIESTAPASSATNCAPAPRIAQASGESPKSMPSNGLARKQQPARTCAACAIAPP